MPRLCDRIINQAHVVVDFVLACLSYHCLNNCETRIKRPTNFCKVPPPFQALVGCSAARNEPRKIVAHSVAKVFGCLTFPADTRTSDFDATWHSKEGKLLTPRLVSLVSVLVARG